MNLVIIQLRNSFPSIFFVNFLILLSLSFPVLSHTQFERAWPIITFTCDKSKNEMKLKNEVKWGVAGEHFQFNSKNGTYNPWDLVKVAAGAHGLRTSPKKKLKLSCLLGKTEYKLVITPKIFNRDFDAKCGHHLSVKVSVYKNESLLVKDKPMEAYCFGNAPVLRGIKIKGGRDKVKFYKVARSQFY